MLTSQADTDHEPFLPELHGVVIILIINTSQQVEKINETSRDIPCPPKAIVRGFVCTLFRRHLVPLGLQPKHETLYQRVTSISQRQRLPPPRKAIWGDAAKLQDISCVLKLLIHVLYNENRWVSHLTPSSTPTEIDFELTFNFVVIN